MPLEWLWRMAAGQAVMEDRTGAVCVRDAVELLDESRGRDITNGGRWRTVFSTGTAAGERDLAARCAPCTAGGLRQSHAI